jgi:hypothetical protein
VNCELCTHGLRHSLFMNNLSEHRALHLSSAPQGDTYRGNIAAAGVLSAAILPDRGADGGTVSARSRCGRRPITSATRKGKRDSNEPRFFVDHVIAGFKRTMDPPGWFPSVYGNSVHFAIGRDGSISQYVRIRTPPGQRPGRRHRRQSRPTGPA